MVSLFQSLVCGYSRRSGWAIAAAVKKEDWNEYVVIAKGNQLIQKINGLTTVEVIDNESNKAKSAGILALQLHAGPPMTVQFKDIQLKPLK